MLEENWMISLFFSSDVCVCQDGVDIKYVEELNHGFTS